MKKPIFIIGILVFGLTILAQEIQHETGVVNIEVPVRVFESGKFVDNLTIEDFEIYEEGVLQNIEAVYFIRKTEIKRKEIKRKEEKEIEFSPNLSRTFVLMFEIIEYLPKIGEVLDYFFESVIRPGDSLIISTPTDTYNLNSKALERVSREEVASQLKKKVRKETILASSEYRSLLRHIREIAENDMPVPGGLSDALRRLKDLTYFDAKRAADFADFLKAIDGQKQVFIFFQKRTIPISKSLGGLSRIALSSDTSFDVDKLKHAFSDSSISCHFLYITKAFSIGEGREPSGMEQLESAMETFRGFSQIAKVTGGLMDSSANASASFERAVDYSESYYLLYYSPKNYKADGKFKKINVKVKGKNYRITHRAGYIAD
jgi:VWFA-related protein